MAGSDNRLNNQMATLSGTPSGQWKDLSVLYPYLNARPGTRMLNGENNAAVAWFLDGDRFTYQNVGLAKMPELTFSAVKTLLGTVELHARTKSNAPASDDGSFVVRDNVSFDDATFDWADVITQPYTNNFGDSPWDDFDTEDGVVFTPTVSWRDIGSDKLGTIDEEITELEFVAAFTPVGLSQSAIDAKMALQGGASSLRGARLASNGADFIVSGAGVWCALRNASLRKAQIRSGRAVNRTGKLEAVANLALSTGAPIAQLFVGTEDPA